MIEIINNYIKTTTTTAAAIITIVTTTMGQNICDSCLCCCDNRQKTTTATATIKNDQTMIALVQLSVDIMWKKWEEISFQSNYTLTRAIIIITRGRPQQQKQQQQQHHTCVYLDLKERNKTNIEQFIINVIGTIKQMIMMKKKQQQLKLKRESLLSAELEKEELCLTAGDWIAWRCSGW